MYNHYIPQSDGSFRRNSMPETSRRQQQRPPQRSAPPPQKPEPKPEPEPCPSPQPEPCPPPHHEHKQESNPLSFLRKLLPKDLDSSDLVIIALLLLLSGEDCDGDTAPLLTLALYFLL